MSRPISPSLSDGFTVAELLVTLIVATMFIVTFYGMFISINSFNVAAKQRSLADNVAYSKIREYASPDISPATWFTCSTQTGSNNDNDRVVNSDAAGTTIASGNLTTAETGLPGPISYTVNALAIYGCAGANAGKPIRVRVDLTYGPKSEKITHAILAGY
ncbi:hypothetical protein EYC58_01190 [Candidatus Saccharibacteria bacterium]|nr:MAG: hypothetical protein EYC58_01190 [Candidatus Saccharibacteria bacterium]